MTKFILWSRDHPWIVIILMILATAFFAYHAKDIRIDASAEGMMIEHDTDRAYYEEMAKIFGSDNITVVYIRDKHLFTHAKLKAIENVAYNLEKIPGVNRVESLFNATNFKSEKGILQTNPLLDWIPKDPAVLEQIRKDALRNPLLNKTLITPDGKGMALVVMADRKSKDRKFNIRLADDIDRGIAPLEGRVDQVFQVGAPMMRRQLSSSMINDQKKLMPLAVCVLLLMLIIGIRTANGAIVPMITGGLSIVWTLGYMAFTGIPLNVLTIIIPALLVVVGSTEDMHMVAGYLEGLEHTGDRSKAIEFFARRLGLAVLLTAFSTYLGFFSIVLNDIALLKQFGWASSFGFLVNPLITFSVIPVYLRFLGERKLPKRLENKQGERAEDFFQKLAAIITRLITKHKRIVLWVSFLMTVALAAGAFKIRVDNDLLGYFKPGSDIRVRSRQLYEELSGAQSFFLVFDGKKPGAFKNPENLKKVFEIEQYIQRCGLFDSSLSLATHVAFINREMRDGKREEYRIPEVPRLIPQYLLFFTRENLDRYVSADYRRCNIIVRHHLSSSYELKKALGKLELFTELFIRQQVGDSPEFKITGEGVLINKAADSMASGQIMSLAVLLLVLFGIMAGLFLRIKAGFLAMAANVIPIAILFGIMGYFKIPLGVGTAMIADIVIGIAVDDTIHLFVRYNDYMKKLNDQDEALRLTLRDEMKPVVTATIGLACGFAILAFSDFIPLIYFGLLSAMLMVLGLIAEMLVTTSLLSNTRLITLWDILGLQLRREVIQQSPLFKNMSPWQIKKVVLMAQTQEIPQGEVIIRQGERDRKMFMILEGGAKVEHVDDKGNATLLHNLQPGEICGEVSLVYEGERTATVTANANTKTLVLDWPALERISRGSSKISSKFFLNISSILGTRLARTNIDLAHVRSQWEAQRKSFWRRLFG